MDRIIKWTICPYFLRAEKMKIKCESFNEPVLQLALEFRNMKKRDEYLESFCNTKCWEGCPIAQLISEKYK